MRHVCATRVSVESGSEREEEEDTNSSMSSGNRGEDVAPSDAPTLPLPHELTAEWTVRAQLTFARGGEPVQREYSTQDAVHPVRVVYKWCTPCEEHEPEQEKVSRQAEGTGS